MIGLLEDNQNCSVLHCVALVLNYMQFLLGTVGLGLVSFVYQGQFVIALLISHII